METQGRIIEVVEPKPAWPAMFEAEAAHIAAAVSVGLVAIHHIGSTAVPGLVAKPIIDILLEVDDVVALETFNSKFEDLGYVVKGEFGIPGRRYYFKGLEMRTHQVHAFDAGSPGARRHIAFRDYLCHHPPIANQYGELKLQSARDNRHSIDGYCSAKNAFVQAVEKDALRWQHEQGFDA